MFDTKELLFDESKLYVFSMEKALQGLCSREQYDAMKLIASFQGLANREKPRFFVEFREADRFWLDYIEKNSDILEGRQRIPLNTLEDFFESFSNQLRQLGLVAWDSRVSATSNVAVTVCGVEGFLPIRYSTEPGSIFTLLRERYDVPVKLDLVNRFGSGETIWQTDRPTTGSAKCDAYIYALENYMDQTNDRIMGYIMDGTPWFERGKDYPDLGNAFIPNHDYFTAHRSFVFDLSPWGDEAPCDDPGQPIGTDLAVFKEILQCQYEKNGGSCISSLVGFTPWQQKYTSHLNRSKHHPVPTEWEHAELCSAYNVIMDADAAGYCGLANGSLYRQFPLKEKYRNNRPAKQMEYDPSKTYLLFFMGDYDSSAWLEKRVPELFQDPARGKYPLMWCFNPNLSDRVPMVFDYVYKEACENDYFATGVSGAGYLNPTLLFEPRVHSDLPDGTEAWIAHNRHYFDKFDLGVVGFLLDGRFRINRKIMELYTKFVPVGVAHNSYGAQTEIVNGIPFQPHTSDIGGSGMNKQEAADIVSKAIGDQPNGSMHVFRTILWRPSEIDELMEVLYKERPDANFELVDPYNFFNLLQMKIEEDSQ